MLTSGSPTCFPTALSGSPGLHYVDTLPIDSQLGIASNTVEPMQDFDLDTNIDEDVHMDSFLSLMDNSITPTHDQWLVPVEQGSVTERADEEVLGAYGKMADFCVSTIQLSLPFIYLAVVYSWPLLILVY